MTAARKVLNVGGGSKTIPIPSYYADFEHLLLDIDPRGSPDVVKDARELAELEPAQFDAIYCSHNLEHYFPHEVPQVLAGFRHVLKPDGFAEIRVPDLDLVIKTYVEKGLDITDVLYEATVGPITVRDVIYGWNVEIARTGQAFYAHKTGFTQKSLAAELISAGFSQVYRRPGRAFELNVLASLAPLSKEQKALLDLKPTGKK
jgi:SAM-dependent methyltransferase